MFSLENRFLSDMRRGLVAGYFLTIAFGIIAPTSANADLRLPLIFGNGAVLQRNKPIPVWGWDRIGEIVTVEFDGQKKTAVAGSDGRWQVVFDPITAGGPYDLVVQAENTITLKNILVGDVWLCSGQSNMSFPVWGSTNGPWESKNSNLPDLRLFTVQKTSSPIPLDDVKGTWSEANADSIPNFSAVAYFAGKELQQTLKVPIGLIHSSFEGTEAAQWTPESVIRDNPSLSTVRDRTAQASVDYQKSMDSYRQALTDWEKACTDAKLAGKPLPFKPNTPINTSPSYLFNAMIAPLAPYGLRGIFWYQGEGNANWPEEYSLLFPAMIQAWRQAWKDPNLPFLFVQLAKLNWDPKNDPNAGSGFAWIREVQQKAATSPNMGMAVYLDATDGNLHPISKEVAGHRLALVALHQVYGNDTVCSGPRYDSFAVEGDSIRIKFTSTDGGLKVHGDQLLGFSIAGADHHFVAADVRLDGQTVVVDNPNIAAPISVRYAWGNPPDCSLYNGADLPCCPFRTDDWPRPGAK